MSAKKARFIKQLYMRDGEARAKVKDQGSIDDMPITMLSRVELIRSAALLGIKSSGGWTNSQWTNDALVSAIRESLEGDRRHGAEPEQDDSGEAPEGSGEGFGGSENDNDNGQEGDNSKDGDSDDGQNGQDGESKSGEGEGSADDESGEGDSGSEGEGESGEDESEGEGSDSTEHPLLKELAEYIKDQGGIVDADQVEQAVKDAVKDLKPRVTRIKLPDSTTRDLPGRQHQNFEMLMKCISLRLNCYLVGPPGTGKSYSTEKAADALGLGYGSLSLGPQTPESRIWGYYDANGKYVATPYRDAYENGKVFCLDELDNGHSGIIASMNQSIAGAGATFPDGWVNKHPNFVLVATANTFGTGPTAEFVGRNILDAATLDRFTTIEWPIDRHVERDMVLARLDDESVADEWISTLNNVRKRAAQHRIRVVCSPRSAADGAALLSIGCSIREALDMRVFRGLHEDQINKLMA